MYIPADIEDFADRGKAKKTSWQMEKAWAIFEDCMIWNSWFMVFKFNFSRGRDAISDLVQGA